MERQTVVTDVSTSLSQIHKPHEPGRYGALPGKTEDNEGGTQDDSNHSAVIVIIIIIIIVVTVELPSAFSQCSAV